MPHFFFHLFPEWCRIKVRLAKTSNDVKFKQGEIWWCSIGMNVGEEIYGKGVHFMRPVLVFRKFTSHSFLGLPLTKQVKEGSWYVGITLQGNMNRVMLNQARILDTKRLQRRITMLPDDEFNRVRQRFIEFYVSDK